MRPRVLACLSVLALLACVACERKADPIRDAAAPLATEAPSIAPPVVEAVEIPDAEIAREGAVLGIRRAALRAHADVEHRGHAMSLFGGFDGHRE